MKNLKDNVFMNLIIITFRSSDRTEALRSNSFLQEDKKDVDKRIDFADRTEALKVI